MKAVAVTVLVLNMHAGHDAGMKDNLDRVAALVRETRADVVLLQEVDRGTRRSGGVDQPAVLERRTGLRAAFGRTLDYDGGTYGIALLARGHIEDPRLVPLPVDPPQARAGGSIEPRGALVARVKRKALLRVVNTHLDASREDTYRLQEVDRLVATVTGLGPGAPLVVGGDFNATPESETHARMTRAGFTDAWMACGRGDGLTYPAETPAKRIDYLFLGPGVRCTSAEVLPSQASDHRAVLVRLLVDR